ncbi:unnamed protein product [Oreochromis niloticus]|nr:unnamed protein product [Mustela putorius furo]
MVDTVYRASLRFITNSGRWTGSGIERRMESLEPGSFRPRGTSTVSLHERFSRVLVEQQTCSRLHQRASAPTPVVLLMKSAPLSLLLPQAAGGSERAEHRHLRKKRSVWTRLGWQRVNRRPSASVHSGFWSFMNKYRWRAQVTSSCRRAGGLRGRLGRRSQLRPLTSGQRWCGVKLRIGGATASKGRDSSRKAVPTKKQLDAELDDYMSMSRSRLDKQLDDYMSMSRSRLDAELDEYMSMAGQPQPLWD